MVGANYLDVGCAAMFNNEEVYSIHGQPGHGVLQLLWCATVTWQAAQLKDNQKFFNDSENNLLFTLTVLYMLLHSP